MKLSESIVYSKVSVFDRVADKIKDMLKTSETGQIVMFGAGTGGVQRLIS
jgi:hypothetical protein